MFLRSKAGFCLTWLSFGALGYPTGLIEKNKLFSN
jgi:hypothetical protein